MIIYIIAILLFIPYICFYFYNKHKQIKNAKKNAIELNLRIKNKIESISKITPSIDEDMLHTIISGQELNILKFDKIKARNKYKKWQYKESLYLMDLYYKKVEELYYSKK